MDGPVDSKIVIAINQAENRIRKYIRTTPLEYTNHLSTKGKAKVYLKLENIQHTGSFKVRGAFSKLSSLSNKEMDKGIITASTGNHGMATAFALEKLGGYGTIYLPENVDQLKSDKLRQFEIELVFYGKDSADTETYAREIANSKDVTFISPYNDIEIIAGQGTIGVELHKQLDKIDHVFVTVGGGGLISGIATYLKSINSEVKVHGCHPENSPVMYKSIKSGRIISMVSKETLSDGSAGGIEEGSITFELCQKLIDDFVLISEDEIKEGIKFVFDNHQQVIEGAAAVAVSGFRKIKNKIEGNVVIVICGGNIDSKKFNDIVT